MTSGQGSVLVTGGGTGLGSATCAHLAGLGHEVHVAGRTDRTGVRRLPAGTVAQMVAATLAMPGAAVITRIDLEQLPAPSAG